MFLRNVSDEHIEGVIDELGSLTAPVELKELERGSLARIKNGNLAVNNRAFRTQQFQSVDKLRVSVGGICTRIGTSRFRCTGWMHQIGTIEGQAEEYQWCKPGYSDQDKH